MSEHQSDTNEMGGTTGPIGSDAHREKRVKVVERVRAMLAKAASTDHEAEAATFEEHALRLMAAWEIEERELRDAQPHGSYDVPCGHFGNAQTGAVLLVAGVARLFGGFAVRLSDGHRRHTVRLTCTPTQFELAGALIDHLLPQLMADVNRDRPRSRRDYSVGWTQRVLERLTEAQARVYTESNALVPTTEAAERAYREQHGSVRRARTLRVGLDAVAGAEAGERVDLDQHRLASRT
jgi:hypothetical protein